MNNPNDLVMTDVITTELGDAHYLVCILRPDQIDLIAEAVVKRLFTIAPAVMSPDETGSQNADET